MKNYAKRIGTTRPTVFFWDEGFRADSLLREAESWVLHHRIPSLDAQQQARFSYVGETSQEWVAHRVLAEDGLSVVHAQARAFLKNLGSIDLYSYLRDVLRRHGIDPGRKFNADRVSVRAPERAS